MGKPKIRFKGFDNDWEQRKFGSLLDETKNKTSVEDEDTLLSCAINGMYLNSELFSHFRGASNVGYLKVKKNDLILSAQNLHLGNCNVNLRFEHGIISPAYKVYELVDCNPLFMQAWVKRDSTKNFFLRASTEGASVCRKNIVWEELYKQELLVPDIEEQKKIGAYFDYLDHLITLHQRKCEDTKKLKKYMLQKMFPQNGSKVPEIRFKGFTDDWEQRKVGDITKELSEYAKLNSGLPLLTSARTGLMYQSDYRGNSTTDNENTLFSIVPLNACTYRHMSDDSTFHINVNTLEKGLVSKEYPVFVENESDLRFVVQYINSSDSFTKFCTEQKKGGTRTRLYYKTLCEYKMLIPSLNEQHIIADYFDNLDYLITLHQNKCEELKKIKKYMLQNMFV